MMIFNMAQADFLIKQGAKVKGVGIHRKTHLSYVYFESNSLSFNDAMSKWKIKCEQAKCR